MSDASAELKIREIVMRTHAHATEDIEKVRACFKKLLPEDFDEKEFVLENLAGSYGNPIRALSVKLSTQAEIKEFIRNLITILNPEVRDTLRSELEERLDDRHKFFFRIAKQALALGSIELAYDSDVIRIILALYCKNPKITITLEDIRSFLERIQIL
jgi:hypothetical protein